MRRTCLAAALLMLPVAALAKWDDFVTTDEAVVYADRSNASRIGNVVRVTSVTDLKRPLTIEQGVVRSVVAVEEYDCGNRRLKLLSLIFHGGAMGEGKVVLPRRGGPGEWGLIEKGSLAESKLKVVCAWPLSPP